MPKALHELLGREAPDVGIEAVGLHYVKSMLHKVSVRLLYILLSQLLCCQIRDSVSLHHKSFCKVPLALTKYTQQAYADHVHSVSLLMLCCIRWS